MIIMGRWDRLSSERMSRSSRLSLGAIVAALTLTTLPSGCTTGELDETTPDELSDQVAEGLEVTTDADLETNDDNQVTEDGSAVEGQDDEDTKSTSATPVLLTKLKVSNYTGTARTNEPVRVGIPISKSANITNLSEITLYNASGTAIPVQVTALARWTGAPSNTSSPLRWVLLSFQASVGANTSVEYSLYRYGSNPNPSSTLSVSDSNNVITVSTGVATFTINRGTVDLFDSVKVGSTSLIKTGNGIVLKDTSGKTYKVDLTKATTTVESTGKNDAVIKITGSHVLSGSTTTLLDYVMRLTFFAGRSDIRVNYQIHNSGAATHSNNLWPLGDSGSRYIEDVSLYLPLNTSSTPSYLLSAGSQSFSGSASSEVKIYQDSSGGENYKSENHMNAKRSIPISFKGYKVTNGSTTLGTGTRVQPWLDVSTSSGGVAIGVRQFWQNFPKALSYSSSGVRIGLFPTEFADTFEIQGAEQKSQEMTVYFHTGSGSASAVSPVMEAMQTPMLATPSDANYYFTTGGVLYEDSTRQGQKGADGTLEASMDTSVYSRGSVTRTYVSQWEMIDEFGWRNYGCVMADHESDCGYESLDTPVSHYNNQYDYINGVMHLFARTLDRGFLEVGSVMARHTADIDINHTSKDYAAYNGGMYWHTTHDTPADISTHRSWPPTSASSGCTSWQAGGPGLGHLYLDGLVLYYFMTGDLVVRDAIIELGNYAYYRYTTYGDETDGRAMGNLLQSLTNVYRITGDSKYYNGAVAALKGGVTNRVNASTGTEWMDSMTGEALGRFLDMKTERGQTTDSDYTTAQSLLKTLADKAYKASQPNDVNQLRWADTLAYAYKHCGKNISYWDKADYLYSYQEQYYWARGTYPNAKDLAILMNAGHMVRYYRSQGM